MAVKRTVFERFRPYGSGGGDGRRKTAAAAIATVAGRQILRRR